MLSEPVIKTIWINIRIWMTYCTTNFKNNPKTFLKETVLFFYLFLSDENYPIFDNSLSISFSFAVSFLGIKTLILTNWSPCRIR